MQLSDLGPIIGWCASIASTLIITFFTAAINRKFDESKKESNGRTSSESGNARRTGSGERALTRGS
jgi:hypothetical protein